jgi:2-oxo-4-hydroxy-4-carboxy-5-ureidoimidazoline decarboxylase
MHTLDQLNALSQQEFVAALDGVFEHAPWVAEAVAAQRPFYSVIRLHEALMEAIRVAPEEVRLGFLRGHPALSPKTLGEPGLTAASRAEQSGLGIADLADRLAWFEAASNTYEGRFGFPFIVCVRRQTPAYVMRALENRLDNAPKQELAAALAEIGYITRLRLVDRVDGLDLPKTTGNLSSHVLDTARGKAAEGVRIELFREGTLIREAITNRDGRTDEPLLSGEPLRIGRYELRFHLGDFYACWPNVTDPPWYDVIPVRFGIAEPEGHYHMPLLLNAWSYTTYRGS